MSNKNKPIEQKNFFEKNKEVWGIVTPDGKVVETFRTKATANNMKKYYENRYFMKLEIKRL